MVNGPETMVSSPGQSGAKAAGTFPTEFLEGVTAPVSAKKNMIILPSGKQT
jgi:hypothetical protein